MSQSKQPEFVSAPPAGANLESQRGMTMLEIMIVLAILGLVMALVVVPKVMERLGESKTEVAKLEARKIAMEAYPQWSLKSGKACPSELAELSTYVNNKKMEDPWGRPYVMLCGDKLPAGVKGLAVYSLGDDGKPNTGDDVKSWE